MQFQEETPPQGLSEARRGSAVFANILTDTDPSRGYSILMGNLVFIV